MEITSLPSHFLAGFAWGASVYLALRFLRQRSEEAERTLGCLPITVPFLGGLAFAIFAYPLLFTFFAILILAVSGAQAAIGCWFESQTNREQRGVEAAFLSLLFAGNAALVFGFALHLWIFHGILYDETAAFMRGCAIAPCSMAFLLFVRQRARRGAHRF